MGVSRKRVLIAVMAITLAAVLYPGASYANASPGDDLTAAEGVLTVQAGDNIASGTWGTCPWEISADGTLTVHPGEGGEPTREKVKTVRLGEDGKPVLGENGPVYDYKDGAYQNEWAEHRSKVKKVVFAAEGGKKVVAKTCLGLLANMSYVESVDLSGLDTSNVTDMESMFSKCSSLKAVDASMLDTSKVTSMKEMFYYCPRVESLDLSGFNTSNVTNMSGMFSTCSLLKSLNISMFNTSKVTDMSNMFDNCQSIETLDLSSFDTAKVESVGGLFVSCVKLETIYAGKSWDVSKASDGLQPAARADESSLTTMAYVGPKGVFGNCTSLVGGNGTKYDSDHVGVEYARIDAPGAPGYLTFKETQSAKTAPTEWKRLSGDIALDTMNAIVQEGFTETGGTVVVATFNGYWDALAAAGLAGLSGAPVLMTDGEALSPQTRSELERLAPSQVFVCGGPAAVSDGACAEIAAVCGSEPQRIYGDNAVATAAQIDLTAPTATGGAWSGEAFLCTSDGYWDALAAAPVAYALHMPIFLTDADGTLSASTLDAIRACGITRVHIAGGTAAVSASAEDALGGLMGERFAGEFAIQTSEAIARFGLSRGMTANNMGVATTGGYWDALAGAALCGKKRSVLVLVGDASSSSIDGFVGENSLSEVSAYVFGGPAAVGDDVLTKLEEVTVEY